MSSKPLLIASPFMVLMLAVMLYLNLANEADSKYYFDLQGTDDKIVKFSDFKDKIVLLYFGYLTCPDVCPTTLYKIANVFAKLSPKQLAQMQVLYITVDPERDTIEDIEEYSKYFLDDDKLVALKGSLETTKEVTKRFGADFIKIYPPEYSALDYLVGHTTALFLFDKNNKLYRKVPYLEDEQGLLNSIKQINP